MDQTTTSNATFFLDPVKVTRFRQGIRAVGQSADALLGCLQRKGAHHNMLGSQLAQLLKDLRQQRMLSMDLAAAMPANPQFDAYIAALSSLRSTVAHWFTLQAADPTLMETEKIDFEMQCFGTLGAGVMWLDSLQQDAMTSQAIDMHGSQMHSSVFGDSQAQGEDITDQVQHLWNDEAEAQHAVA